MQGIDVSQNNGVIDWEKVKKAGKEFVFVRMGLSGYKGGIWRYDPMCKRNVEGALKAGLKVGIYVYGYDMTPLAATKTANEVVYNLKGYDIEFPIAFDLEETNDRCLTAQGKKGLRKTFEAFASVIKASGYTPMLYTYTAFMYQYLEVPENYDIWIADYREPTGSNCPSTYNHTIWQYRGENGSCDGVGGACDLNVCYKDYSSKSDNYKELYFAEKAKVEKLEHIIEKVKSLFSTEV